MTDNLRLSSRDSRCREDLTYRRSPDGPIFEPSPFHSCSLYCNALDELLLYQCTVMTSNHHFFPRQAVGLDFGQIDGPDGRDLFEGGR